MIFLQKKFSYFNRDRLNQPTQCGVSVSALLMSYLKCRHLTREHFTLVHHHLRLTWHKLVLHSVVDMADHTCRWFHISHTPLRFCIILCHRCVCLKEIPGSTNLMSVFGMLLHMTGCYSYLFTGKIYC